MIAGGLGGLHHGDGTEGLVGLEHQRGGELQLQLDLRFRVDLAFVDDRHVAGQAEYAVGADVTHVGPYELTGDGTGVLGAHATLHQDSFREARQLLPVDDDVGFAHVHAALP